MSHEVHNPRLDAGPVALPTSGEALPVKSDSKPKPPSALPLQTVAEELAFLRKTFRDLVGAYAAQLEAEITRLHTAVADDAASKKKLPGSRTTDLRDMLMLLRSLEVKPAKGRRRDLKKVENLVEELRLIVDRWE
jgi:hypothetical protein